jgi:carbamoyltransferase
MSDRRPWVLGLSNSHNGAACLLKGDEIVAAVQEERLTRTKRQRMFGAKPSLAIAYCLEQAGIEAKDLDLVVYSAQAKMTTVLEDVTLNPQLQVILQNVPVLRISHHMAHAVSAFAVSGFEDAAVLVVDGMGSPEGDLSDEERAAILAQVEDGSETISLYHGAGTAIRPLEKHMVEKGQWMTWDFERMPRFGSLGGLFSALAWQIFGSHDEAGKVMGLAPYGTPEHPVEDFFRIVDGRFEFSDAIPRRFNFLERWPNRQAEYQNLSASAQLALEEALLYLARRARELSGSSRLCYAGGVALNSVANERIMRECGFEEVYVIPAAEDSGPAIGAAYHGLWHLTGQNSRARLLHDAVGRSYSSAEIGKTLERFPAVRVSQADDVIAEAVDLLCAGKILGWFHGRSELGPRALGQRSILCDPRSPDAKAVLNSRVKHREGFRPFAPAVLLEKADEWFELDGMRESPYMLRICRFREDKKDQVPAVVHVDGTGRLQTLTPEANGRFYDLVKRFGEKTGVPILLNTSFNIMGEPIVETPEDALWCFLSTGIDACVLEDRVVTKEAGFRSILDLYPRITAPRYTVSNLFVDGRMNGDANAFVTFSTRTPWGRAKQIANPNVLPVLGLIDGRKTGREILEKLPRGPLPAGDDRAVLGALQRWTMAIHGEGLVDGTVEVIDIANTLYREKIQAYDEATLTRMLVRLRRMAVVSLSGSPAS